MANFDARDTQMESEMEEVKDVAKDLVIDSLKAKLDQMTASMTSLSSKVEELSVGLTLVQRAMANGNSKTQVSQTRSPSKLQIPKPKAYDGKRDAQEIDEFVWRLERYFEAMEINDDLTKVRPLPYTCTIWLHYGGECTNKRWKRATLLLQKRGRI